MKTLDQIRNERIKKIEILKKAGTSPYPSFNQKRLTIEKARELMGKEVQVAGRVFSLRGHGKLIFADLKDQTGKIQLMFKVDTMKENEFEYVNLIDIGDFTYVSGTVTKTVKGEISILVSSFQFLAKSTHPLPEKWHGLKDVEERYRQRYVDLLTNEDVRKTFLTRTSVIQRLRSFLDKEGFIEVETPVLQSIYGGASAKPFTTHHNVLDCDLFLRISDELYLKRLIVGGFEKVYEIGKDFRNEGMSRAHNPEFTMLEFYWAYVDYNQLMDFTEKLISSIIQELKGGMKVEFAGKMYDFTPPWKRISYREAMLHYAKLDIDQVNTEEKLIEIIKKNQYLPGEKLIGYGQILDALYKKMVRPHLEGPLFLTDHPIAMKPLAKSREDDPTKAASFQLLVAGDEFINAYNELNDPQDQRNRWLAEMELGKKGALDCQTVDEDYIRALEYGMPPTAGWGLGVDRLVAFLTNQHTIKDVILFPTLKPEK